MRPSIHVFTLDCLRKSVCSTSTTPFLCSFPIQWSRCYSSGTWTLPSHASLVSGQDPIDHGVTDPESSVMREHGRLMTGANENGYETALFSENPQFSSITGFDDCFDVVHDFIGRKLLPSEFTPKYAIDELSLDGCRRLTWDILSQPNRLPNLVNTAFTAYRHFSDQKHEFPHHGDRVISHLCSYLSERTEPMLTVTNVLEPHNPYWGSPPGQQPPQTPMEDEALRNRRSGRYQFTNKQVPPEMRDAFSDYEEVFAVEERIYEAFSREADRLIERFHNELTSRFEEDLVILVGDHGQLFGAEGEYSHSTSLHPHGIHVPLAIDPPAEWTAPKRTISDPVSMAGLGRALMDVVANDITSTAELIDSITEYSRRPNGAVLACADGTTTNALRLFDVDRFEDDLVKKKCVRKVACIYDEYVDVYSCHWDNKNVNVTSYRYSETDREAAPERDTPPVPNDIKAWITQTPDYYDSVSSVDDPDEVHSEAVKQRLEKLGYQ